MSIPFVLTQSFSCFQSHIEKYVNSDKKVLKTALFHGSQRGVKILPKLLKNKFDVVVVSYNTLVSEMSALKKRRYGANEDDSDEELDSIFGVEFRRVVLGKLWSSAGRLVCPFFES
jgi:SNF2 family DNA or RNA helicase